MSNVTRWVNRAVMSVALALAVFVVGFAASATKVAARPELAGYNNRQCWECHVNPMGGGMRNAKGNSVAKDLSLSVTKQAIEDKYPIFDEFEPELSEHFAIGGDMRLLWYDQQVDEDMKEQVEAAGGEVDEGGTFYEMQAVFHLRANPLPILTFVYSPDVAQDTFEAYGLIHDLPLNSYIKGGRFILPFGLRMEDHTNFTRDSLGFSQTSQDTGVEVGIRPGPAFITAAFTNGLLGQNDQDRDEGHYAVTTQAGVRFWKIGLGASWFHNNRETLERDIYGPWGSFGIGPVVLLGEFDTVVQEYIDPDDPTDTTYRRGSAGMAQLDVKIIDGLYFQASYNHTDPDWEVEDNFYDQTMGGIMIYPMPYMKVLAQYRHIREAEDVELDNDLAFVQGHFFF